ncbi:hypothetical protein KXD40_000917 [Peronospora effusa]|uniref:Uncharacterized protein n=1 Tax=Peronospora effusa TaxID=542832 RepID=A0A3R7W2F0_9STRA|nr:hypothetical protein DD237_005255 [Peronospora effusa]UIZ21740.1 hypothetical protein KXD40_000917 [Peronospora effusa]
MRSNDSQKIIVVGIPKTLDDGQLSDLFNDFGTVIEAKVVLDTTSNTSRGFGFVTFTAASSMRNAIKAMNRKVIEGRTLNVRQLVPKETFQAQKKETPDTSERPCWLLRKGKCTEGANCPFSHDIKDGEFGNCFEFVQTGECKHGNKCKFSHPVDRDENEVEMERKKKERINGDKRVCYSFQNGRCHRGKKCLYVHEMLVGGDVESAKNEKNKKEEVKRQTESGNKRKRLDEKKDKEVAAQVAVQVKTEKKMLKVVTKKTEGVAPKFEWKAKAQTGEPKEELKQDQGRELQSEEPQQHWPKTMKMGKVDMGAAFDGVSDDEARPRHGSKKKKVDKETMRANREKLIQERRAKRNAKKMALSKLRVQGEVELLA